MLGNASAHNMDRPIVLEPPSFFSKKSPDKKHFNSEIVDSRNFPSKVIRFSDENVLLNVDSSSHDAVVFLQDLVKHQEIEITRLTEELQKSEEGWRSCIRRLEEHSEARISSQVELVLEMERRMEMMMKEYKMEVERTLKEKSDLLLSLSLARKVLEDEENKFKEEKMMMMEKISQQEEQLQVQGHELMQMRSYISQSDSNEKAQREEVICTEDQSQKSLEEDLRLAESEKKLLEEKLMITTELMKLQEDEIEQASSDPYEARKNLLNRWRSKVFELLVQLKFSEKFHSDEERKLNRKVQTAEGELESLRSRLDLSERSGNNKTEEIRVLAGKLKVLQNELDSCNGRMDRRMEEEKCLRRLCSLFMSSAREHFKNLEGASSNVSKLHSRLKFASYRVDAIKSQINARISNLEVKNASLSCEVVKCKTNHVGMTTARQRLNFSSTNHKNDSTTVVNNAGDKSNNKTSLVEEVKLLSSIILRGNS